MQDENKRKPELFPVAMLKNYRPSGEFKIEQVDASGKITWRDPDEAEKLKVWAGSKIQIAKDEARVMISNGIAERGDEI